MRRWLVAGVAGIAALEAVTAAAARLAGFDYTSTWPLPVAFVIALGYVAARETGRARTGAAVGAPAGAADAIAAWLLGWALRLPAGADGYDWSWLPVAVAAGAVFGTLEGAVGGWIGARRSRTRARTA